MLKIRLLSLCVMLFFNFSAVAETIKVAAIDWCPQICPDGEKKGYVVDYINEIYKDSGYSLDIQYFPWSRAIRQVLTGKVDALLSPAKAEAPSLRYPQHEVGIQRMCFFTAANSSWQYQGTHSLKGMQVGIAIDTSIEELNEYVEKNLNQFQYQPYHERYIEQNAGKLDKARIDTFLFTRNSTIYELTKMGMWKNYREAGCTSEAKIYMAFSPESSLKKKTNGMIKHFDSRASKLTKEDFLATLLQSYQL